MEGDECVKFQEGGVSNKKGIEYVDVEILSCGDALFCLEDKSSSTGARCVDFKETFVKDECIPAGTAGCTIDSDCCDEEKCTPSSFPHCNGEKCSRSDVPVEKRVCSKGGVFCGKDNNADCEENSDCCVGYVCGRGRFASKKCQPCGNFYNSNCL